MASVTDQSFVKRPELDEDLLTCEICRKLFNRAKILPCGHTFCQECLETWAETNRGKELTCPNCRTPWQVPADGIEKLPANYHVNNLVDFVSASKKVDFDNNKMLCEYCEIQVASSACIECRQLACDTCTKVHKRIKITAGHQIVCLKEYKANYESYPARLKPTECDQHPGSQLKFFCQTCSVPICTDCTIIEHRVPEHEHIYLHDAAREIRNLMSKTLTKATDRLKYFEEKAVKIGEVQEKLTNSKKKAIIQAEKHTENLVKTVLENGKEIVRIINDSYEEKTKVLGSQLDRLELAKGQVKSYYEHSKSLVELGTDAGLMSVHKQIEERLESLLNEEIQVDPQGTHHLYYSLIPSFGIGKQGSVQSLPVQTVYVSGSKGNGPGQFKFPSGVAVSKVGDIFVADVNNRRIQVFDMGGQYKKHFTVDCEGERVRPSDVSFTKEDHLVIADCAGKQVCVCDTDGKLLREFGKGEVKEPRLLAVSSDGHVHVTDWDGNDCVRTFTPEGRLVRTIGGPGVQPGQFNNAHSVAVNSKDQIIVSDAGNHRVQVFDSSGTFLFACGKRGEGEGGLQKPYGVTADQYDNIIVCDYSNYCIQMFSPEGVYIGRVDDPNDGVKCPQAIATVPGHPLKLIVGESDKEIHQKLRIIQDK